MSKFLNVRLVSQKLPILLRTPEEGDDEAINKISQDPSIADNNQWLTRRASISEIDALAKIQKMRNYAATDPPARVELVVVLLPEIGSNEPGTIIGMSGISDFEERPGKKIADLNSAIVTEHRQKGYFIEALILSAEFAFNQAKCNTIAVIIHEEKVNKLQMLKDEFGWKRGVITEGGKFRRYEADKLRWTETKEFIAKRERQGQESLLKTWTRKAGRLFGGN